MGLLMAPAAYHRQAERGRVTRRFVNLASIMLSLALAVSSGDSGGPEILDGRFLLRSAQGRSGSPKVPLLSQPEGRCDEQAFESSPFASLSTAYAMDDHTLLATINRHPLYAGWAEYDKQARREHVGRKERNAGVTSGKQVPLAEVSRLREQRRKLHAKLALLEAEREGWLAERARLISTVEGNRADDSISTKDK